MAAQANAVRNALMVCGIPNDPIVGGPGDGIRPTQEFLATIGWTSIEDIQLTELKDIPNFVKAHNTNPQKHWECPMLMVRKLSALVWHVKDLARRGQAWDPAGWTAARMRTCVDKVATEAAKLESGVAFDTLEPGPITIGMKYPIWESDFINFLTTKLGTSGVPLVYVVRQPMPAGWEAANDTERLIHEAVQEGEAWEQDKQTVFGLLKSFCKDTDALVWIKDYEDSRDGNLAFQALRTHYMGEGEQRKRLVWAQTALSNAHYKNEFTFSFEKFSTTLKEAYRILNACGETHGDIEMVRVMLEKMAVPNSGELDAAKTVCRDRYSDSFEEAVAYLSREVTSIFPNAQLESFKKKRKISAAKDGGPGRGRPGGRGGGGGRGDGPGGRPGRAGRRGGRGRGGRSDPATPYNTWNGVDIRDVTRDFTEEEYTNLGPDGRAYVGRLRRANSGGAGGGGGGGTPDNRTAAQVETDAGRGRSGGRGGRNGARFGNGAGGRH